MMKQFVLMYRRYTFFVNVRRVKVIVKTCPWSWATKIATPLLRLKNLESKGWAPPESASSATTMVPCKLILEHWSCQTSNAFSDISNHQRESDAVVVHSH